MPRATFKQIRFIESLLRDREVGSYYDSVEAQSIRCGKGDELSIRQASQFIDALLECPRNSEVAA